MIRRFSDMPPWSERLALPVLTFLVIPAFVAAEQVDDRNLWWRALSILAFLTLAFLGTWVKRMFWNGQSSSGHPRERTASELKRPHLKVWRALGHPAIPASFAALFIGLFFAVLTLNHGWTSDLPSPKDTQFTWVGFFGFLGLIYFIEILFLSSAFRRRHPAAHKERTQESLMFRLGHRARWVAYGVTPFLLGVTVWSSDQAYKQVVQGFLMTLLFISMTLAHKHSEMLCETCQSDFRVDAPEYAQKKKWIFSFDHVWLVPTLTVMYALMLVSLLTSGYVSDAFFGVSFAMIVMTIPFTTFHLKYNPWCPYCHGGDDGGESMEVPDPSPSGRRPMPV